MPRPLPPPLCGQQTLLMLVSPSSSMMTIRFASLRRPRPLQERANLPVLVQSSPAFADLRILWVVHACCLSPALQSLPTRADALSSARFDSLAGTDSVARPSPRLPIPSPPRHLPAHQAAITLALIAICRAHQVRRRWSSWWSGSSHFRPWPMWWAARPRPTPSGALDLAGGTASFSINAGVVGLCRLYRPRKRIINKRQHGSAQLLTMIAPALWVGWLQTPFQPRGQRQVKHSKQTLQYQHQQRLNLS